MDPRLATIRVVLACLVSLALVWCGHSTASMAWVVPMLMMPPLSGCTCSHCSSTPSSQMQAVISGVANGFCGTCTNMNATWVMDCDTSTTCTWEDTSLGVTVCTATYIDFVVAASGSLSFVTFGGGCGHSWERTADGSCAFSSSAFTYTVGSDTCSCTGGSCSVTAL
jgi:hypothetical protein